MKNKSEELVLLIDSNKVGCETNKQILQMAKDNNLVIVYAYSDDNMEFKGALREEIGCFDGGSAYVTSDDISFEPNGGMEIRAVWHNEGNPCWTYETDIPHEEFRIYADDEIFCIGIVFSLDDVKE